MAGTVTGRHRPPTPAVDARPQVASALYLPGRVAAAAILVLLIALCLAVLLAIETAGSPAPARARFVTPATYGPPGPTGGPR